MRFLTTVLLCSTAAFSFAASVIKQDIDDAAQMQTFYNPDRGFYTPQVIHFKDRRGIQALRQPFHPFARGHFRIFKQFPLGRFHELQPRNNPGPDRRFSGFISKISRPDSCPEFNRHREVFLRPVVCRQLEIPERLRNGTRAGMDFTARGAKTAPKASAVKRASPSSKNTGRTQAMAEKLSRLQTVTKRSTPSNFSPTKDSAPTQII